MGKLLIVLLIVWVAVAVLGALIEGLLWLVFIGAALFVATAVWGWFKARNARST